MNFAIILSTVGTELPVQYQKLHDEISRDRYSTIIFNVFDTLFLKPYLKWEDFLQHLEVLNHAPGFAKARSKVMDLPFDKIYSSLPSEFKHM